MPVLTTATEDRLACRGIRATRELFRRRELTITEHVQAVLDAIDAADARPDAGIGAYVAVAGDQALRQAENADSLIGWLGDSAWRRWPLLGVTISVKDLIQTQDLPTTRGSLLPNQRPRADAPLVRRLRTAGAIVIGKTATSEYGWSASTVSRVSASTRNPWATELTAGGSSGGAAAAVAAGLCCAALGTDGAGSIRIPAAFCGVTGFKPSFGRIPYVPPCVSGLAHAGPIARSVADVAELASVLTGPGHDDPGSMTARIPVRDPAPQEPSQLRIGWIEFPGTSAEVREVSERVLPVFRGLGHRVDRIEVPFTDPYDALVDILAATEAAGTRPDDEQRCDQGRLEVVRYGRTLSGADVMRAEGERLALRSRLWSVMERYDLLAMATVPIEPFGVDAIGPAWAADPRDLRWLAWSPATYPFNLTGQPAISLPAGLTSRGLPAGVQLVGRLGDDDLLLSAAGPVEAGLGPFRTPPDHLTR